jgi:hypothetical protein
VRFAIEIYSVNADEGETILHRTSVNTINPIGARKEARQLLNNWKKRKASGARVINAQRQTVYDLRD